MIWISQLFSTWMSIITFLIIQNHENHDKLESFFLMLSNYLRRQKTDEFYILILQHHSQVISKLQSVKITRSQGRQVSTYKSSEWLQNWHQLFKWSPIRSIMKIFVFVLLLFGANLVLSMKLINQKLEPKAKGDSEVFVDDSENEIETESGVAMKTAESRGWVTQNFTVGTNHHKCLIWIFPPKYGRSCTKYSTVDFWRENSNIFTSPVMLTNETF